MDTFLAVLQEVLASMGSIILFIIGALVIIGIKLLCKKIGINIDSESMNNIIFNIQQVINYLNQKYVDQIKDTSPNGKLTEYQQKLIKEKAYEMLETILTTEQIEYLLKKYNLTDIRDVLDLLIESNIQELKLSNKSFDRIPLEISNMVYNTEKNTSISEHKDNTCSGNCSSCTLCDDCEYI